MTRLAVGDRVIVAENYHWAQGARGTVGHPPEHVLALAEGWSGFVRHVEGVNGSIRFHWVAFDVPQKDADGDGPFNAGEVDVSFLEPESSGSDA